MANYPVALSDGLRLRDTSLVRKGTLRSPSSRLVVADTLVTRLRRVTVLADRVRIKDLPTSTTSYHVKVTGGRVIVRGALNVGLTAKLLSRLALHDAAMAGLNVRLRERLALKDRAATNLCRRVALRSTLKLADKARLSIGVKITEAIRLGDKLDRLYAGLAAVVDHLSIHAAVTRQLQLVVVERDGIMLAEHDVLRMVFSGQLYDGLEVALGFSDPADGITTWAMNTRTGAVTEYTDYAFNSFAKFGRTYLAADDTGLYELRSDTDAGSPIIADMISGLVEMTGANLTTLRAAYVAVRGDGDFVLKLVSGDGGKAVSYRVRTRSLRTARVELGKGWRTRYFTFELISTGQDFDLQGIEFLPVASIRRI